MTPDCPNIGGGRSRAIAPGGTNPGNPIVLRSSPTLATILAAAFLLGLPACSVVSTPETFRGNKVDADQLKELVVGTSTKADATSLIGSPTARASFDDNRWLYISETTHPRIGRTPGILTQGVTELQFDQAGVLRGVKQFGPDDRRPVDVATRSTPSPGSEASFMQQLLGNVGKFSTGAAGLGGGSGVGVGGGSAAGGSGGTSGRTSTQGI